MDIKITLALIAAITSLIVSFISIFFKDRNQYKYSRLLDAQNEKNKIIDTKIKAMDEMNIQIQKIKDTLQLFCSSIKDSVSASSALKIISKLREETTLAYEKCHIHLEGDVLKSFHSTKNLMFEIENTLIEILKGKNYVSPIDENDRKKLLDFKLKLTDIQNSIRDCKINAVNNKISGK